MKLLFLTTVAAVVLSTSAFAVDRRPPGKSYAKVRVPTVQRVISDRRSDCVYSRTTGRELGCDPDPFVRSSIANDPSNSGD